MRTYLTTTVYLVAWSAAVFAPTPSFSQSALNDCSEQFIDGKLANAPTIGGSAPDRPFGSNRHLCYQDDGASFFAVEYWPEQFAPRWAAYKLDPANYGPKACRTYTRGKANCYVKEETWAEFLTCEKESDPFHSDRILTGNKLGVGDFGSTGHDRGHIAPRQAFSWHVCATYQTFTMANMSPQRAFLNQDIWQFLEQQVLTWAIDEGQIYVVSGATYRKFPASSFQVYKNGTFDEAQIYSCSTTMLSAVTKNRANFQTHAKGDRLRPKRNANPAKVKAKVEDLRMPTGYYKVIYRPAMGGEPAHAIGFLLPHTYENINNIPRVKKEEAFWAFVARIDLIEQTAGMSFPGIPTSMKRQWGDSFFLSKRTGRTVRDKNCGIGTPQGVATNTTKFERQAMCTDHLN